MPIATRLTNTGTLLVNGLFDEINSVAPVKLRTTANTVYAVTLDEVTYNTATPTIKNLFKYTETFFFDYTNWTLNSGRMTQNAVLAPDGRSLAPKLIEDTVLSNQRIYNWHAVTAGTTYTYSIFLKPAERYIIRCYFEDIQTGGGGRVGQYLNLQTGTIISTYQTGSNTLLGSNLQYIDNGWYRYSWTVQAQQNAALNSTAFVIFSMGLDSTTFNWTGDGTSGMYIWGAQKEIATAVTDYQGIGATTLLTPNFARRETQAGNMYVTKEFDEFTGAPVVDTGLMVWVDAAQTASYSGSGATWTDLSGNGKNYTLSNSPTFSSTTGGGVITFAGASSQYATTATTLFNSTTTNTYTMNLWVYPTGAGQLVAVTGQATINTSYHYSAMEISAVGVIKFGQWTGAMTTIATSTQSLNAWYNLVITYNGTTATAYINGTSVGSSNIIWSAPGANTFFPLMAIDGTNMGTNGYASGSVGAFMAYNRALTAAEVTTNFNALRGRYGI